MAYKAQLSGPPVGPTTVIPNTGCATTLALQGAQATKAHNPAAQNNDYKIEELHGVLLIALIYYSESIAAVTPMGT